MQGGTHSGTQKEVNKRLLQAQI